MSNQFPPLTNNSHQSHPRQEKLNWLLSQELTILPVAPPQSPYQYPVTGKTKEGHTYCAVALVEEKLTPKPLFTGKNPSYLDSDGKPHIISHRKYQKINPTPDELITWFASPFNGVGILHKQGEFSLDLDRKHFPTDADCEQALLSILESEPSLNNGLIEKTHSGGYRVVFKSALQPDFTNFSLTPDGEHLGELLGKGRFAVLAPTIGVSGNEYTEINRPEQLPLINNFEFVHPTKTKKKSNGTRTKKKPPTTPKPQTGYKPGLIHLEQCGHPDSHSILNGGDIKNDRSHSLATAANEWFGWENWLSDNSLSYSGDAVSLCHYAGSKLGIDSERIDRIIDTIDKASVAPACYSQGGDASCWLKVRKLDKQQFEDKCPQVVQDEIKSEWNNHKGKHNSHGLKTLGKERNNWKCPQSWNGELGYWQTKKKKKGDKETVSEFIPLANFDFQVIKELCDADGGGLVLNMKRSLDSHSKVVILRSTEYTRLADFVNALKRAYGAGIVCNLSLQEVNNLIHNRILEYRLRGGKTYKLADRHGEQDNGIWVFRDLQFDRDGNVTDSESSLTLFNPQLGGEDRMPVPIILPPNEEALPNLVTAMSKFFGSQIEPALLTLGWVAAGVHFQTIIQKEGRFPLLNLVGDAGSGKSVVMECALSLVGWLNNRGSFSYTSQSRLYENLKLSGSLPLCLDDPKRSRELDELLKQLYNAKPRLVRGNYQEPHSPLAITSNHYIGDCEQLATLTRLVHIPFYGGQDYDATAWDELLEAQQQASGALPQLISLGYPKQEIRLLASELRELLPNAHLRVADSLALILWYALAVCEIAGFDGQRIRDYVKKQLCGSLNALDSNKDSLTDFLEKVTALRAEGQIGEWNTRVVNTKTGEYLALIMSSVWKQVDRSFAPSYSKKIIETLINQAGGQTKSVQKFYRSSDEYKAYMRSLLSGHNEGDNYIPPKPPNLVASRCVLIPINVCREFINSWEGKNNSTPVTPVTVSYPQLPLEVTDCNQDISVNSEVPDRPVTPVTPQKSIITNPENDDNHNNHCGGESEDKNAPIANTFSNDETDVTDQEATAEAELNQELQPVTPADNQLVTEVTGCNQDSGEEHQVSQPPMDWNELVEGMD